jgi:anti-sigma regulatory factor (Ser/Thr protein kinase)
MGNRKVTERKGEEIRQFIIDNVGDHPKDITRVTAEQFNVSRQAVLRHIRKLDEDDILLIKGITSDRMYSLAPIAQASITIPIEPNLAEDKVWRQHVRPMFEGVGTNILDICQYGVSEMVNNVIDHSDGQELEIKILHEFDQIKISILDDGIGIFHKIQTELGLDDPLHVILELSKGKLTTDPERHTGEGIFFTSRMFDNFAIASDNVFFIHLESSGDWIAEDQEDDFNGTFIRLIIDPKSKRTMQSVFSRYESGDELGFTKTKVPVHLVRYGDENLVSRSQAKRLLARFERFREVILDFNGVEIIGRAFADEIFRVFQIEHPEVKLIPLNANPNVMRMINRSNEHRNSKVS